MKTFRRFLLIFFILFFFACSDDNKQNPDLTLSVNEGKEDSSLFNIKVSDEPHHRKKAEKIDQIFEKLSRSKSFNGAVLVTEGGSIIYNRAIGYADFNKQIPLTIHSSFHLASVSKQFTAMCIMILKERGKLKYDDDIKEYIPEIPYEGVTVRHLLTHTSGIPNILNYIPHYMTFWDSCQVAGNSDLAYILSDKKPPLQFKPGKRFSYNNTGYVLLALIVEKISGKSFEEFVEEEIFQKIDMNNSIVYSVNRKCFIPEQVRGYGKVRNYYNLDEDDIRNGFTGEKGVYSSVIDLYKWDQALYTEMLVKKETLDEAFEYARLENGKQIKYSFGWRKSIKEPQIVYHFGHWRGFNCCLIRFTEDKNLIVILNNTGSRRIKGLASRIRKILYEDGKEDDL